MKPLTAAFLCIGTALALQSFKPKDSYNPVVNPNPNYSAIVAPGGYPIIGTPEQTEEARLAMELVDYFDQDVYGADTPQPTQVIMSDYLVATDGSKAYGVASLNTGEIYLQSGRSLVDGAGTAFHERLHLAGHDHDFIYPIQRKFVAYLKQQGY